MSPEAMAQARAQGAAGRIVRENRGATPQRRGAEPDASPGRGRQTPDLKLFDSKSASTTRRRKIARRAFGLTSVAVLFVIVLSHGFIDESQFRIDAMKTELTNAQALNQKLTLQVAQLKAPQRVVTAAEKEFGMIVPGSIAYLYPVSPQTQLPAPPGSPRH